jgi:hypothetical protein
MAAGNPQAFFKNSHYFFAVLDVMKLYFENLHLLFCDLQVRCYVKLFFRLLGQYGIVYEVIVFTYMQAE